MHSPASNNDKDPYKVKCHIRAQCAPHRLIRVKPVIIFPTIDLYHHECDNAEPTAKVLHGLKTDPFCQIVIGGHNPSTLSKNPDFSGTVNLIDLRAVSKPELVDCCSLETNQITLSVTFY